jgi:hypothetical protein
MSIGSSGDSSSGHADTWVKFSENDTWHEYEIKGVLDFTALISVGLMPEGSGIENEPSWNTFPYAVEIGTDVTSIEEGVFYCCYGLTSLTIGENVTNIGKYAFAGCTSLTSVTFQGKTMEQVQEMDDYPWDISNESIITVA